MELEDIADRLYKMPTLFITGSSSLGSRSDLEALLTPFGIRASGSISKKLGIVVACSEHASAEKIQRAESMGIPIISDNQLYNLQAILKASQENKDVPAELCQSTADESSDFSIWPMDLHFEVDQLKRYLNGEKIKSSAIKIDCSTKTAVIIGSDPTPYQVSLSTCTCFDFNSRGKPCKHIYRLAKELGIFSLPATDAIGHQAVQSAIPIELDRWKAEFLSGSISAQKYIKLVDALLCE